MRIGIQLTPDGRRFELDLIPNDEMWCLNMVGHNPVNRCDESRLITAFQLARQTAECTAKQRERELKRCRWDLPWQCPHYPHMPCKKTHATQNPPKFSRNLGFVLRARLARGRANVVIRAARNAPLCLETCDLR